jgi:hypothetical protein
LIPGYGHSPLLPVAIRGTHHVEQELGLFRSRLQGLVDLASGKGDREPRIRFRRIHELGLGTDLVHPVSFPRRRATHMCRFLDDDWGLDLPRCSMRMQRALRILAERKNIFDSHSTAEAA